jgi:ribosome-associated protein
MFKRGFVLDKIFKKKEMKEFDLNGHEFIELNKLLKLMKIVSSGGEANGKIENGEILVNGNVETRKRNKLRVGDIVTYKTTSVIIK